MKSELEISLPGSSKPSSGFFPLEAFGTENKNETYSVTLTPPDKVSNTRPNTTGDDQRGLSAGDN